MEEYIQAKNSAFECFDAVKELKNVITYKESNKNAPTKAEIRLNLFMIRPHLIQFLIT